VPRWPVAEPPASPDVSVVLIGYNDRANLPRAVRSVLDQTLRNLELIIVDDASTDGSADLAEELTRDDARARVVRLPVNSGGCSRPRNAGIDAARAPYVMFLDSDDYFERHACKNLLVEAERTGADVASGRVVRLNLTKDKETPWAKDLFRGRAVYRGIRENPSLFFDPLSTNKIFRREFLDRYGIRFPEGVHYEDSLFSTEVYCQAATIAVIPKVVYYWRVVEDAEEASITHRRHEIENFRDRIAVHRMMDDFLRAHGAADLKVHKDFKFIRHDLKLYLTDLAHRDEEYQKRFMLMAAEYLATVSEQTLAEVYPLERICVHLIRRLDVEETLRTVDYLRYGFKLSTDLVERDGRVFWTGKYLETPEDRGVMDVTEMGFHRLPFSRINFYNQVTSARVDGAKLHLEGSILNQLRRISADDEVSLLVSVRPRGRSARRTMPVRDWTFAGSHLTYRTVIDLNRALGPLDQPVPAWDLRLEVTRNGETAISTFSIDPGLVSGHPIRVRGRLGGTAPGLVEPYVTTKLNLSLQQSADSTVTAVAERVSRFSTRARWSVRWRSSKAVGNNPTLKAFAYKVFRRLPVQRGLAVFESHMGKQYSDSPRYIYEAAVAAGLDRLGLKPVWSYAAKRPEGFPADVRLVRRESWRYHFDLARAEFWVDNQGFPRVFARRRETTYVQTWHGTPLKRMGFDSPALERASAAVRRQHKAMMRRWSALLVPSEYFVETFVASYGYEGTLVRKGLPRNDLLVRGVDDDWVLAKKRELGLPTDRRLVLYCPTFRDRARRLETPYELPLDLELMRRSLGDDLFLLVRTHYLDNLKLSNRYAPFAADVSKHHDVTELMLLADVLVTDYSSVMFDFANTGRPMVFFAYDYEDYVRDERGTYVDLPDIAPGPVVGTNEELIEALLAVDKNVAVYADRYDAFRDRFCTYETGHAAEDVVERFLGRRGES
jgi:CDP-glycerol glycerophosphotransferase